MLKTASFHLRGLLQRSARDGRDQTFLSSLWDAHPVCPSLKRQPGWSLHLLGGWVLAALLCFAGTRIGFSATEDSQTGIPDVSGTPVETTQADTVLSMKSGTRWMGGAPCVITDDTAEFVILDMQQDTNGWMVITWESCSDHLYEVEATMELTTNTAWQVVATMIGSDGETLWKDAHASAYDAQFYRVHRLAFNDDADEDGLSNLDEFNLGTNLHCSDTDGDGMPDGWEARYGLDPSVHDAAGDFDADGTDNLTEYLQGRDPTKGVVSDSNNLVKLNVFTPLE